MSAQLPRQTTDIQTDVIIVFIPGTKVNIAALEVLVNEVNGSVLLSARGKCEYDMQ